MQHVDLVLPQASLHFGSSLGKYPYDLDIKNATCSNITTNWVRMALQASNFFNSIITISSDTYLRPGAGATSPCDCIRRVRDVLNACFLKHPSILCPERLKHFAKGLTLSACRVNLQICASLSSGARRWHCDRRLKFDGVNIQTYIPRWIQIEATEGTYVRQMFSNHARPLEHVSFLTAFMKSKPTVDRFQSQATQLPLRSNVVPDAMLFSFDLAYQLVL